MIENGYRGGELATENQLYRSKSSQSPGRLEVRIIEAIAEVYGKDVLEIETQLWDAVDMDALSELFEGRQRGRVKFPFAGCVVEIEFFADRADTIAIYQP